MHDRKQADFGYGINHRTMMLDVFNRYFQDSIPFWTIVSENQSIRKKMVFLFSNSRVG